MLYPCLESTRGGAIAFPLFSEGGAFGFLGTGGDEDDVRRTILWSTDTTRKVNASVIGVSCLMIQSNVTMSGVHCPFGSLISSTQRLDAMIESQSLKPLAGIVPTPSGTSKAPLYVHVQVF